MRNSEFWNNMADTFGATYSRSVAADQTLPQLEGQTVNDALKSGWELRDVWIAVCRAYPERVPSRIWR